MEHITFRYVVLVRLRLGTPTLKISGNYKDDEIRERFADTSGSLLGRKQAAGFTSVLATTSAIGDITNYLKLQLNGADIWIPYFTSDPSV